LPVYYAARRGAIYCVAENNFPDAEGEFMSFRASYSGRSLQLRDAPRVFMRCAAINPA
jgi:hypothetical protein